MIPNFTIYSDKVKLTANYYIEYLGFNMLYNLEEEDENPFVWLELNGQFLLIWPWNKKIGIPRPVELEVNDILGFYADLAERAKINIPLLADENGKFSFSVFDCEGNIISFTENSSSIIQPSDDLTYIELAGKQ